MLRLGGVQSGIRLIGGASGDPDPLAGISFIFRLQTHLPGSNSPLGLFQDTACTIPATQDGDPIAAWKDVLSTGLVISQSDVQKQPILFFDNGIPTVLPDGVDDNFPLPDLSALLNGELTIAFQRSGSSAFGVYNFEGDASSDNAIALPDAGIPGAYDPFGLATARPFFSATAFSASGWHTYNVSVNASVWRNSVDGSEITTSAGNAVQFPATKGAIFKDRGGNFFGGNCVSVIFGNELSTANRSLVISYTQSLLP